MNIVITARPLANPIYFKFIPYFILKLNLFNANTKSEKSFSFAEQTMVNQN